MERTIILLILFVVVLYILLDDYYGTKRLSKFIKGHIPEFSIKSLWGGK